MVPSEQPHSSGHGVCVCVWGGGGQSRAHRLMCRRIQSMAPNECWQETAFRIYLKRMFLEMQRRCLTIVGREQPFTFT